MGNNKHKIIDAIKYIGTTLAGVCVLLIIITLLCCTVVPYKYWKDYYPTWSINTESEDGYIIKATGSLNHLLTISIVDNMQNRVSEAYSSDSVLHDKPISVDFYGRDNDSHGQFHFEPGSFVSKSDTVFSNDGATHVYFDANGMLVKQQIVYPSESSGYDGSYYIVTNSNGMVTGVYKDEYAFEENKSISVISQYEPKTVCSIEYEKTDDGFMIMQNDSNGNNMSSIQTGNKNDYFCIEHYDDHGQLYEIDLQNPDKELVRCIINKNAFFSTIIISPKDEFDAVNLIAEEISKQASTQIEYQYDENHQPISAKVFLHDNWDQTVTQTEEYIFDIEARVKEWYSFEKDITQHFSVTYNSDGNISGIQASCKSNSNGNDVFTYSVNHLYSNDGALDSSNITFNDSRESITVKYDEDCHVISIE